MPDDPVPIQNADRSLRGARKAVDLLVVNPIGPTDDTAPVAQEGEVEVVDLPEQLVAERGIPVDAEDSGAVLLERPRRVAGVARLRGACGREVEEVEGEDDGALAELLRQIHRLMSSLGIVKSGAFSPSSTMVSLPSIEGSFPKKASASLKREPLVDGEVQTGLEPVGSEGVQIEGWVASEKTLS